MTAVTLAYLTWAALSCGDGPVVGGDVPAAGPCYQHEEIGFLYQPAFCVDEVLRGPPRPYQPQPGDVWFSQDKRKISLLGHRIAGGGPPNHTMTVVARPDGRLAALEAGPYGELDKGVCLTDLPAHLKRYEEMGMVWVRQRKVPLTPEQSACLTTFALKQEGKPFARIRTGLQVTPFRARGPILTSIRGDPDFDQHSYFCGELAMNALVYAGLLPYATTKPATIYPRDMFFGGRSGNEYVDRSVAPFNCGWEPPCRWTQCPH